MRRLDRDDIEAALIAGLFLSAGGRGRSSAAGQMCIGQMALDNGGVDFRPLDAFASDDVLIVATGVGAPGGGAPTVAPSDAIESARALLSHLPKPPVGVMCGHVPGFNAWLVAAALGIAYVDAAANGRGHPTVMMGGMGLAARTDVSITQVGIGGTEADGSRLQVAATGNISLTEKVLRRAAALNGGLIFAARGPLEVGFVRDSSAPGAISFQLDLGHAMLATSGTDRVVSVTRFLDGDLLISGDVVENTVVYQDGFDLGHVVVGDHSSQVRLGVLNEFMTAERDGARVATFPDMIGALDPSTGDPLAISELPPGSPVSVIIASRANLPIGKGAVDPAVFPEVEQAMGADLRSYL